MPEQVLEARRLLAKGEPKMSEALAAIDNANNDPGAYPGWWCLEGPTHVICALFTESAVIFIEGKAHRTRSFEGNQIRSYSRSDRRNLDCARRYGKDKSLDFYAMLIIEDGDKQRAFKELVFPMPDGQPIAAIGSSARAFIPRWLAHACTE
jgi:hypothetical protein